MNTPLRVAFLYLLEMDQLLIFHNIDLEAYGLHLPCLPTFFLNLHQQYMDYP